MKSRETKHQDLAALTESLQSSKSAMVVSFSGVTVAKDQEFRNSLREAGAKYQVVKNTLARIAVKGTQFEETSEYLKGVTAIAWTDNDPVVLSKAISKFIKENANLYTFKTGIVDGSLVDLSQVTSIANLPSKEELISKLLFVLNSGAQRIVTVINAVPRDLAVVIRQIGEQKEGPAPEVKTEDAVSAPSVDAPPPAVEASVIEETTAPGAEASAAEGVAAPAASEAEAEAGAETDAETAAEPVPLDVAPAAAEAPVEAAALEAADGGSEADENSDDILEIAPEAEAKESGD